MPSEQPSGALAAAGSASTGTPAPAFDTTAEPAGSADSHGLPACCLATSAAAAPPLPLPAGAAPSPPASPPLLPCAHEAELRTTKVTPFGPRLPGVRKYLGGAPTAAGDVLWGVPAHCRQVLKLDLASGTVRLLSSQLPDGRIAKGPFKWLRGVLAPDGAVFCIPACADFVLRIDPDGTQSALGEWTPPAPQRMKDGCA